MLSVYIFEIPDTLKSKKRLTKLKSKSEIKRRTSLYGELIVKKIASKKFNISPEEIIIERTSKGKPYLKNFKDFYFNISHSSNLVAVAFSDSHVGIDVEKLSTAKHKISKRYFSEEENLYIKNHPSPDLAFYEIWTAKEAYFKRSGEGISPSFFVTSVLEVDIKNKIHTIRHNDFIISVCSDNPQEFTFNITDEDF